MLEYKPWSKREKAVARAAFDLAYARETTALLARVKEHARRLHTIEDVWELADTIRHEQRALDQRYDYRYSVLLVVFADLVRASWLSLDELAGLSEDKRDRIATILAIVCDERTD